MTDMKNYREQDVQNGYLDGIDMGISHMADALACGLTMLQAIAYAKDAGKVGAEHQLKEFYSKGREFMRERRMAVAKAHGVERASYDRKHDGKRLA